jgi:hypothetical protein
MPSQNTFFGLKTNFPFHWLFLDCLLSSQNLKERVKGEEKEKALH